MKQKSIKLNSIFNILRQVCAMLFPIITFPYVSRILQSENYGKVNFVNSVVSYFILLASLGINSYAIREGSPLRKNKQQFQEFANQIFTINMLSTLISYILLILLFLFWKKLNSYGSLVLILSLTIISWNIGVEWLYSIYEDFGYITFRSIVVQIISLVLLFVFVRSKDDYLIYAAILVLSTGGANLFNFIHAKKYIRLHITKSPNIKRHIIPMLILFCNSLMTTIYVNSDITILGILRNDIEVGEYSVAVRIYSIIKSILNAMLVVTLPRLSFYVNTGDKEHYDILSKKTLKSLLIIVFPAVVGLLMVSPDIVLILVGNNYSNVILPLRLLSIALAFTLIGSFFVSAVLIPHKKEKLVLYCTIVSAVINLILNFILIPKFGMVSAAITTIIAECIVMIMAICFSRGIFSFKGYKKNIIEILIGIVLIVIICILVDLIHANVFIDLIMKIVFSCIFYGMVLLFTKNEIFYELSNEIKKKFLKR